MKVKKPEIVRVDERADADDAMASAADPQIASLSAREASDPVAEASHRLDPALFAESFAKKKSNARPSIESKRAQGEATGAKSEKKRSRLAKGRDGQPMKRLKDGRTTVRVLPKPIRFDDIDDEKEGKTRIEEVISQPILMDPTEILPNAKVRAFKKRKLGLKEASPRLSKATSGKPIRTEDDPLGLEDPSFMKGGEYVKGDRQNPPRNKLSPLKGRRTKCESSLYPLLMLFQVLTTSPHSHTCNVKAWSSSSFCTFIVRLHLEHTSPGINVFYHISVRWHYNCVLVSVHMRKNLRLEMPRRRYRIDCSVSGCKGGCTLTERIGLLHRIFDLASVK